VLIRLGKGRKDRYAPIGRRALGWIDRYLQDARPQLVQDPSQRLLFVTLKGGPVHPNNVSAEVRRYLREAGIHKQGACHLFRHTAASLMLDAGADVRHLQEILGHQNLGTTQIYTHVSIGKLCEVHARTHPGQFTCPTESAEHPELAHAATGATQITHTPPILNSPPEQPHASTDHDSPAAARSGNATPEPAASDDPAPPEVPDAPNPPDDDLGEFFSWVTIV
jgi:hypothetical protein